jgi:ribosomal protein S4
MLKKTLLKNTHEFLDKNFPENFFLKKKKNKKRQKIIVFKTSVLKKKLFQFNSKNLLLPHEKNDISKKFSASPWQRPVSANKNTNYSSLNKTYTDFLFSMHMIKSEFEKKQNKNSDFKTKLKEKKKLSILYGNLSTKQIKKTLQHANKLQGNTGNNLIILLESRLDVILYRALFFSSLKFARKYVKYNKVLVNSQPISINSYKVKFGDIVSIENKYKKCLGKNILKYFLNYNLYAEKDIEKQFLLKLNKENLKFKVQEKFLFNLVISNQMKLNESKTLSLYKSMFFLNKVNLKKNKHCFNFIRRNSLALDLSKSFLNFFNLSFPFNNLSTNKFKSIKRLITKSPAGLLGYKVASLQKKSKLKNQRNKNICLNRNFFSDKQRYTISNFDLALIQNQIKPINKILLKKTIYKLNEIFKINNFISYTEKYKIFTKTNCIITKHPRNVVSLIKKPFLLNEKKINVKLKILLTNLNKAVIKQSKQLIIYKTNKNSNYNIEKKYYTNNLILLNLFKHYDILFFLKLKNLFFKKREFFYFQNLSKKIYFKKNKPLNLEISYKSLSIINLFPCQKIVFPCSLDVDLLY